MRPLVTRVSALLVLGLSLGVAACDGGFDDEKARQRCDQERTARGAGTDAGCVTDEVYEECLDAYAECGDDVAIAETCPTQFSCPAD
jgi:hypothetical protein